MKPVDKFGRELYPQVFSTLKAAGRKLKDMGYTEHPEKFNLLSRQAYRWDFRRWMN